MPLLKLLLQILKLLDLLLLLLGCLRWELLLRLSLLARRSSRDQYAARDLREA